MVLFHDYIHMQGTRYLEKEAVLKNMHDALWQDYRVTGVEQQIWRHLTRG